MYDENQYEEAAAQLEHIEMVKRTLCALLDRLTESAQSGMFISVTDYDHAAALIREAIDEMFYEEAKEARKIRGI